MFSRADQQIVSVNPAWKELEDQGEIFYTNDIFHCAQGMLRLADRMRGFDYLLLVYADHLSAEERSQLDRLSPIGRIDEALLFQDDDLPRATSVDPRGFCR